MIPLDLFLVSKIFRDTFLVRPQRSDRPGGSRGGTGASFEGRPEAQGVVTSRGRRRLGVNPTRAQVVSRTAKVGIV